ncbi:MAG: hypothetical protein V1492_05835 [Candidatus Micrarchaeota archaeon]
MRYHILLLFLLLFASMISAVTCIGYQEEFNIRVLDALVRPVSGANVQVTFDRGTSFGEQYFTTAVKKTDDNGLLPMVISNQGTTSRKIDCNIVILASYGSTYTRETIIVNQHNEPVDVRLPVYRVTFLVHDQKGRPLPNATVFFLNETKKTDAAGSQLFFSQNWTMDYFASYRGGKESGFIDVEGDTVREIVIPVYYITLNIKDDNGVLLPATVIYLNESYAAPEGTVNFTVYSTEASLNISYGGLQKTVKIKPKYDNSMETIYFDIHAPVVKDIQQQLVGNRVRLLLDIRDDGEQASRLDPSSIRLKYRVLPSEEWQSVGAFAVGPNKYGVDFPEIEDGRIVEFSIIARDYDGNSVEQQGRFVIQAGGLQNNTANNSGNNSGNQQQNTDKSQEFPWLYVVFGVIFIIIVFYIVKFIRENQNKK